MRFAFPAHIIEGMSGPGILTALAQWMATNEEILNLVEVNFENTVQALFGKGILDLSWTDPLLSAGTGLVINIAPHNEINGFENIITIQQQVPLPANSTKFLWVLQNNEDDFPSYVLTDTLLADPSDDNTLALILGSVTTNDTSVINITPLFSIVKPLSEYTPIVSGAYIPREDIFTLAWDAAINTRAGGTLYQVTLMHTPITGAPIIVTRDNVRILPTIGFTFAVVSGNTVLTFLDGWKPITDAGVSETIIVDYSSAT